MTTKKDGTFSASIYSSLCDQLGDLDSDLKGVLQNYGYPPMWSRPNSFETLVHIILEQQVSLASAKAALEKLRSQLGDITPEGFLKLNDEQLRSCYFSRQKTSYVRHLANEIVNNGFNLESLEAYSNDQVRQALVSLKGIGNWTADVYLMFTLQRADIFPSGDLAAVKAMKALKKLNPAVSKEELISLATRWSPYRTIATMILWHYYLSRTTKTDPLPEIKAQTSL
jgi:DNA-3-methyladenine glycosylase II